MGIKSIVSFGILGFLFLCGCSKLSASESGGSIVGNGMQRYENSVLGLSFSYPVGWKLSESSDRTNLRVDNSPLAPPSSVSSVEVTRLRELNGKRIRSPKALLSELKELHPNATWKEVQFVGGRKGFRHFSVPEGRAQSSSLYYVLDENYNILFIELGGFPEFGGEDVVHSIVGSLVIDVDAPELFEVRLEPEEARPGDEVTATIVAVDDASGIDDTYFMAPSVDLADFRQNWFGYDVPHSPYDPSDVPWDQSSQTWLKEASAGFDVAYEPAAAFPFTSKWTRISKIRYRYSFRLPVNAPAGNLVLANIALKDIRGNVSFHTLEPSKKWQSPEDKVMFMEYYERKLPSEKVARVATRVARGVIKVVSDTGFKGDALELSDMYWDFSLVRTHTRYPNPWSSEGANNSLLVEFKRPAEIVATELEAPVMWGGGCFFEIGDGNQWQILLGRQSPASDRIRLDYFFHSFGYSDCNGLPRENGTHLVSELLVRDNLGNLARVRQKEDRLYQKHDFGLEHLGKPVVFQHLYK